jgi:branched-chain amino acid transport system permease protein
MVRRGRVNESEGVGGALDRAVAVQGEARVSTDPSNPTRTATRSVGWAPSVVALVIVALLPFVLHGFWIGLVALGVAYSIVFLSFSLVVGEGGMVWLCMVTFAGVGGLATAQLATNHHWPILAAVLAGGIIAAPMGVIIGIMTIRLGDLYVALVTLTFGLLMENLVFSRSTFLNSGIGVTLNRPSFAQGNRALTYLGLIVFVLVAVFIVNLRRSTTGMALTAVRWSEPASKTIGVSVLQMKVVIAGLAAFVAGIGGALLAVAQGVALPSNYATLAGLIWLAVLVTQGIRSNVAAMLAGLSFTLLPGVVLAYLPTWFGQIPPILFGLGAILLAKNPDGLLATQARILSALVLRLRERTSQRVAPAAVTASQPGVGTGVGR